MADTTNGNNASPSPVTYSQVITDSQSTVTLASAFISLVAAPAKSLWSKRASTIEFRTKLGEWASEAFDHHGRWMQPVLRTAALRDHLICINACPVPSGQCTSSYGWAQLLYALGINPGMNIVSWRVPPTALQPGVDTISLLIDGEALCHIVNLFRCYDDTRTPLNFSRNKFAGAASLRTKQVRKYLEFGDDCKRCEFSFGALTMDSNWCAQSRDKRFRATFEPGTQQDLSKKKVPFPKKYYMEDGEMQFEQGPFMAKYWAGMENATPVTDDRGIGLVPVANAPLLERIQYYVRSAQLLDPSCNCAYPNCECGNRVDSEQPAPRLVTYEWLEHIARIKRRATTDGGNDTKLLEYLLERLLQHPPMVALAKKMHYDASSDRWEKLVKSALSRLFLFADGHVELLAQEYMLSGELYEILLEPVKAALGDVVNGLGNESRFANLANAATSEGVLAILNAPHVFTDVPVYIMELGRDHIFWKSAFEIE